MEEEREVEKKTKTKAGASAGLGRMDGERKMERGEAPAL